MVFRVPRLASRAATAVSAALASLLVGLWAMSDHHVYGLGFGRESWRDADTWVNRGFIAKVVQGHVAVDAFDNTFNLARPEGIVQGWGEAEAATFRREHPGGWKPVWQSFPIPMPMPPLPPGGRLGTPNYSGVSASRSGFGYERWSSSTPSRTDDHRHLLAPAWLPLAACCVLPAIAVARAIVRRQRRREGCCVACGYDLRGVESERCAECGADVDRRLGFSPPER